MLHWHFCSWGQLREACKEGSLQARAHRPQIWTPNPSSVDLLEDPNISKSSSNKLSPPAQVLREDNNTLFMRSMLQEKTYSPIGSSSETTQTIQKKTSQGYSWLGIHSESGIRDSSRHGSITEANCIHSFQVAPAQTVTTHGNGNGSMNLGSGILVAQDAKLSSNVSFFHFSISLCKQRRHYCSLILCNDVIMGNSISDSK